MHISSKSNLLELNSKIIKCFECKRLVNFREKIAKEKLDEEAKKVDNLALMRSHQRKAKALARQEIDTEYNSSNTKILDKKELTKILLELPEVQSQL